MDILGTVVTVIDLCLRVQRQFLNLRCLERDGPEISAQAARVGDLLKRCRDTLAKRGTAPDTQIRKSLTAIEETLLTCSKLADTLAKKSRVITFFKASDYLADLASAGSSLARQLGELQLALSIRQHEELGKHFTDVRRELVGLGGRLGELKDLRKDVTVMRQRLEEMGLSGVGGGGGGGAVPPEELLQQMRACVEEAVNGAFSRWGMEPVPTGDTAFWQEAVEQLRGELGRLRAAKEATEAHFLQQVAAALSMCSGDNMAAAAAAGRTLRGGGGSPAAHPPSRPAPRVLPSFCCPITLSLMRDPVVLAAEPGGRCFERAAIETWLRTHNTNPVTNEPLPTRALLPALAMRRTIEEWLAEHRLTHEAAERLDTAPGGGGSCRGRGQGSANPPLPPPAPSQRQQQQPVQQRPAAPAVQSRVSDFSTPVSGADQASRVGGGSSGSGSTTDKNALQGAVHTRDARQQPASSQEFPVQYAQKLLEACRGGDAAAAERLLASGALDPNIKDEDGNTLLVISAGRGHTGVVAALLRAGADCNAPAKSGWTPLTKAASNGHTEVVRALLGAGADTEADPADGFRPLHMAALFGHVDAVRLLLEGGADARASCKDGFTPLHTAASCGQLDAVRLLLEAGADARASSKDGRVAADMARRWFRDREVRRLLAAAGGPPRSGRAAPRPHAM